MGHRILLEYTHYTGEELLGALGRGDDGAPRSPQLSATTHRGSLLLAGAATSAALAGRYTRGKVHR